MTEQRSHKVWQAAGVAGIDIDLDAHPGAQRRLAALSDPSTSACAARALAPPSAAAALLAQAARAVGPSVAGAHDDSHSPALGNSSLHSGHPAAVDDHSVGDLHAVAKGGVARSLAGDDENA